jgi:hypothetical protein
VADGTSCNDGNACTQLDFCRAGVCGGGSPVVCTSSNPCLTAGECNPVLGICTGQVPVANGTSCNDNNACTLADSCQNGACVPGSAVMCTSSNPCLTAGICDPAGGICAGQIPVANGTACATPAGQAGTCTAGACVVAPPPAAEVQAILNQSCISCHGGFGFSAAGLDWTNVRAIVTNGVTVATLQQPPECSDVPPVRIIEPGNPDRSYMVLKITPGVPICAADNICLGGSGNPPCRTLNQMPLGGGNLPANQIDTIRRWIAAGAL